MDTLKKLYREILLPACLISTVLCFVFSAILHLSDSEMVLPMVNLENLTQIFVFSLILAASFQFFSVKKLAFWLALTLHFLCFLSNIAIVFFLIGKHYTTARNAFVVLFVFALFYVIIATIGVTIRQIVLASKAEKKTYKRQF